MENQAWWHKSLFRFLVMPALALVILGGLIFWYRGRSVALAAERVLEPDRAPMPAPEPAPLTLPPLLEEGEDSRFPTSYQDRQIDVTAGEDGLLKGRLILANYEHLLPEGYAPEDLTVANDLVTWDNPAGLAVTKAGLQIDRVAAAQLLEMAEQAREEGITGYLLQSGFRDFSYQTALYQNKVRQYLNMGYSQADAGDAAAVWVARPKESEHHTGLSLDLSSRGHPSLETSYYQTENGRWLDENCWRFGFVIRYPEDKTEITRIGYEPWHLRYVGRPHSDYIHSQGWCLEEYHAFLREEGGYTFRDADGTIWQVDYQRPAEGKIRVPASRPYTVSGDGSEGFILTVKMEESD